jgi:hypothetical protein
MKSRLLIIRFCTFNFSFFCVLCGYPLLLTHIPPIICSSAKIIASGEVEEYNARLICSD